LPKKEILRLFLDALWALFLPFGLVLALRIGLCTPTEGGALMALYSLIVGKLVYKELKLRDLPKIMLDGGLNTATIMLIMAACSILIGLLLTINGTYLHIFLSADKVTAETLRFGNSYLYIDLSLYAFLGFIFVARNCVQGIGKPQFVLGAGAAELVARVAVCLLLPAALAGGVVSAEAPQAAVYGLCVADPFAWMSADAVLCIPFFRNIMKEDYRYLYSGSGQGLVNGQ
ncbi:MAG: TRAP transporter large permease subunit, partial [Oscillibacter sp.]|nr:TRAP transporter large permease subunit [Oscillibacter sp.]